MTTPADLDLAAARLGTVADGLVTVLDEVVAHHRPDVWTGGRARRFGDELADRRLALSALAEDLRVQAAVLHARAEALRLVATVTP